jgi:hypothetical protein
MERTITAKSPKKRARVILNPHQQSKKVIAKNTILFNLLTNNQQLPAQPRDFRASLAGEEKDLGGPELSDILSLMVKQYLLDPFRNDLTHARGRPKSDADIVDERRGRPSHYDQSELKLIVDELLTDTELVKKIDSEVINSETFYRFLKYAFETLLYQMKENEKAFLNTMRGPIMKYGLKDKKELDSSDILVRDLTPDKIKMLSKGYAIYTKQQFQRDGKNVLYTVAFLFFMLDIYGS